MKSGARVLGVAASDGSARSYLAGPLVRADRVVDGFAVATCRVGGLDATDAACALFDRLDREDCRAILLSGIAPAWFNLFDLEEIQAAADRPVISVSFESSPGLESALREHFSGEALEERLGIYRSLPPRDPVDVGEDRLFVRAVGCDLDRAVEIVRASTHADGVPEPIRVAGFAAGAMRAAARGRAHGI
ncbi:MAG: DUF99 family protein [Haloferacaceae archaeon]